MNEREELELLCSRALDGDLGPAEHARLKSALDADADLRAFMASLQIADAELAAFAEIRVSDSFREDVLARLTPVHRIGARRLWAMAAAVALAVGVGVTAVVFQKPPIAVEPPRVASLPLLTRVVSFSAEEVELYDAAGRVIRQTRVDELVELPAQLRAPAGAYAVLQLGEGSAVLSPGTRATLVRDEQGVPKVTEIDGELYLESWARARLSASLNNVVVSVNSGGATLRNIEGVYSAVPSYGSITVGPRPVGYHERALIGTDSVEVDAWKSELPEWAVRGRADAIKQHVRTLLGEHYDAITPEQWKRGDKLLTAVLARPADRAVISRWLELLLRHGFFDDATPQEVQAWTKIAEILADGTTDADVPEQVQSWMNYFEAEIKKHPERVAEVRRKVREALERYNDRRPHGDQAPRD